MTDIKNPNDLPPIIIIKRRKHAEEHQHSSAWKIALADFMTTLMIVFFVMWIVNIMPPNKKLELVSFFKGKADEKAISNAGVLPQKVIHKNEISTEQKIYYALEPELKKIDPSLKIYLSRGRLEINLNSNVLFDPGKSNIKSNFKKIIYKISEIVKNKEVYVDVYGYADNTPIAGGTNLMLSATRAQDAAKEFISQGIPDSRMGVHGEGDRFPVAANDTEEGRSLNRRIVIYISPMHPPKPASEEATQKAPSAPNAKDEKNEINEVNEANKENVTSSANTPNASTIENVKDNTNNINTESTTDPAKNPKSSI